MKKPIAVLAAVAVCGAVAVPAFAATKTVKVGPGVKFGPSSVAIAKGGKVKFQWTGGLPHNVRVTKAPKGARKFNISTRTKGTVTKTFTRRGTYSLLCDIHAPGMRMTVKVR